MELLLGCGSNRAKKLSVEGRADWSALTTLDNNPDHAPDVLHDLETLPLPFADDSFDEIHAYEVLEHTGRQGDYRFFFGQFADLWRMLKPGGYLIATVPAPGSPWVWGDPSHTRFLPPECLVFLNQPSYSQVGTTAMSDFRNIYKADFDILHSQIEGHFHVFILKAVKPSRMANG